MTQIYFTCQCDESKKKNGGCGLGWRAVNCGKSEEAMWHLYQAGVLHEISSDFVKKLRSDGKKIPAPQGIALSIQKILKSWLKIDDTMTANKLLIKLTERRQK